MSKIYNDIVQYHLINQCSFRYIEFDLKNEEKWCDGNTWQHTIKTLYWSIIFYKKKLSNCKHWMPHLDSIQFVVLTGFSRLRNSLWSFPRTGAVKWWRTSLACKASRSSYSSLHTMKYGSQTCQISNPGQRSVVQAQNWLIHKMKIVYDNTRHENISTECWEFKCE